MTDKEIIIDGADVSKCPDLMKEYLPSCYCSILDKENQEASCAGCFCLFKIKQYMNNNQLIEDLKYELKCRTAECEKYKQAFDKIKEVCLENTHTFADGTQIRYDSLDDILDIINKAKDGKNE